MTAISLIWSKFKVEITNRKLNIQCVDSGEYYYLCAFDGPLEIDCCVLKDNGEDQTDFETNYLANTNQSPTPQVITQFEKRDKTIKLSHGETDVDESGNAIILLKIPGIAGSGDGRWISSGIAFFDTHTPGDKVTGVYFTDEDNILGYGAGFIVGSYTDDEVPEINRGWAIPPTGWVKAEALGGYGFAPAGFYIKVIAFKAGASPSGKFYCNWEWGKVE